MGDEGGLRLVLQRQGTSSTGDRYRRSAGQVQFASSSPGPRLRHPLPLARRHSAQPAGQSRATVLEVLALRHRRRHLQLRDENGRRRFLGGPGHAGRSRRHQASEALARRIRSISSQRLIRCGRSVRPRRHRQTNALQGGGLGRGSISRLPPPRTRGRAGKEVFSRARHLGREYRTVQARLRSVGSRLDPQAGRRQSGTRREPTCGCWSAG